MNENSFPEDIFETLAKSGYVSPGAFIGLEGSCITLRANALAGGYTDTPLTISVEGSEDHEPHPEIMRVSADLSGHSRDAIEFACNAVKAPRNLEREGLRLTLGTALNIHDHLTDLVLTVFDQCLLLDCLAVYAGAYDADSASEECELFDIASCLAERGIVGEERERLVSAFRQEADSCIDHVTAAYSLPYNLGALSETGMIDEVLEETRTYKFSLYSFTFFGRWIHGDEIITALRTHGFTDRQIAYIICHDDEVWPGMHEPGFALGLCSTIERSVFNPADELAWAEYVASATGPLSGFL